MRTLLIIIVALLLLPTLERAGRIIHYVVDQERIARELCVNRYVPAAEMCSGVCYIATDAGQFEDPSESLRSNLNQNLEQVYDLSKQLDLALDLVLIALDRQRPAAIPSLLPRKYQGSVFRPPSHLG